jgi:hypothetical protein
MSPRCSPDVFQMRVLPHRQAPMDFSASSDRELPAVSNLPSNMARTRGSLLCLIVMVSVVMPTFSQSGPAVSLSTTSVVFPQQVIGTTSKPITVKLTNTGTANLNVTSVNSTGPLAQSNDCVPTVFADSLQHQVRPFAVVHLLDALLVHEHHFGEHLLNLNVLRDHPTRWHLGNAG